MKKKAARLWDTKETGGLSDDCSCARPAGKYQIFTAPFIHYAVSSVWTAIPTFLHLT